MGGHYSSRVIKHARGAVQGLRLQMVAVEFIRGTHPLLRKDILLIHPLVPLLCRIERRTVVQKKTDYKMSGRQNNSRFSEREHPDSKLNRKFDRESNDAEIY